MDADPASLPSPAALLEFHARHKMELLAHDPEAARALGRSAAAARAESFAADRAAYAGRYAEAMRAPTTPGRHANALLHLVGHVRDRAAARALAARVEAFREGRASLREVKRELAARLRAEGAEWAAGQTYLATG